MRQGSAGQGLTFELSGHLDSVVVDRDAYFDEVHRRNGWLMASRSTTQPVHPVLAVEAGESRRPAPVRRNGPGAAPGAYEAVSPYRKTGSEAGRA